MTNKIYQLVISAFLLFSCTNVNSDRDKAMESITIPDLEMDVKELGSDSFLGRGPFTEG